MLNIVVIEDNDDLRLAIVSALRGEGHNAVGLDCAEALAEQNSSVSIDLLVIDLNLPGEDGVSLARRIRDVQPDVGIVMLTARTRLSDRKAGYESGADIYLTKPFLLEELNAAIQALSRRLSSKPVASPGVRLDTVRMTLHGPENSVALSENETAVLAGLIRAPGQKLESWQVGQLLVKADELPTRNAINVAIFRLNGKLVQAGVGTRAIRAIRSWGYQLGTEIQLV